MTHTFVQSELESPSGANLYLYSRMPDGRVRATVQIAHGLAEHGGRYRRFAKALSAHGFSVFVHDQRGHGKTTAPDVKQGVFARKDGWVKVMEDMRAVNAHIRHRDPDMPVLVFGHSMGSIAALNFAIRHPEAVDGLACWNTGIETGPRARIARAIVATEAVLRGRQKPSAVARSLTFETFNREFRPNRTKFDWLSRDTEEVDAYVADPDCGFDASTGLWMDLLEGIFYADETAHLARLHKALPTHILGGAADPCSTFGKDMRALAHRMEHNGMTDVTLSILEDTRHESLFEINREETMASFIAWLEQRFP